MPSRGLRATDGSHPHQRATGQLGGRTATARSLPGTPRPAWALPRRPAAVAAGHVVGKVLLGRPDDLERADAVGRSRAARPFGQEPDAGTVRRQTASSAKGVSKGMLRPPAVGPGGSLRCPSSLRASPCPHALACSQTPGATVGVARRSGSRWPCALWRPPDPRESRGYARTVPGLHPLGNSDASTASAATSGRRGHQTCRQFGAGNGIIGVRSRVPSAPGRWTSSR